MKLFGTHYYIISSSSPISHDKLRGIRAETHHIHKDPNRREKITVLPVDPPTLPLPLVILHSATGDDIPTPLDPVEEIR